MRNPVNTFLNWWGSLNVRERIGAAIITAIGLMIAYFIKGCFDLQVAQIQTRPSRGTEKSVAQAPTTPSIEQNVHGDNTEVAGRDHNTYNYYPKNEPSPILDEFRQKQMSFEISNLLTDFEQKAQEIVEQHGKMVEQIPRDLNANGQLGSGRLITLQYEQAKSSRKQIQSAWQECERGLKNTLFKFGTDEIFDPTLKARYESVEQEKKQSLEKILSMTDDVFKNQNRFSHDVVANARKSIIPDAAIPQWLTEGPSAP